MNEQRKYKNPYPKFATVLRFLIFAVYIIFFPLSAALEFQVIPTFLCFVLFQITARLMKFLITRDFREGLALFEKKQYKKSIEMYKKSTEFFEKHRLLDLYPYMLALSTAKDSYIEKASFNTALCYIRMGDVKTAKDYLNLLKTSESFQCEKATNLLGMISKIEIGATNGKTV